MCAVAGVVGMVSDSDEGIQDRTEPSIGSKRIKKSDNKLSNRRGEERRN
jgi:hypothetical protein